MDTEKCCLLLLYPKQNMYRAMYLQSVYTHTRINLEIPPASTMSWNAATSPTAYRNSSKLSKQQEVWSVLPLLWWKQRQKATVYQDPAMWLMAQISKLDLKLTWRSGLHCSIPSTTLHNVWLAPALSQGTRTWTRVNGYILAIFFLSLIIL